MTKMSRNLTNARGLLGMFSATLARGAVLRQIEMDENAASHPAPQGRR